MKLFTHSLFTHRRVIIIFLLAIFIPSLVAAYLSLSTFPKRREAVRKLFESNLWISGESALNTIEGILLNHEQAALKPENYFHLIRSKKTTSKELIRSAYSEDSTGHIFLLDADFNLIFPEIADENESVTQWEKEIANTQFAQLFKRAEYLEFLQKNYILAADLYKKCTQHTSSDQYRAIALEGLGRCFFLSNKYDEANKVFYEVSSNYGQLLNNAGQPFGIVAAFQLSEIARVKKEEENSLAILLDLYKQIRDGTWSVSQPSYDFYIAEIETILNSSVKDAKFPEIQKPYLEIQKQPSLYKQLLIFRDFLEQNVVPGIKERLSLFRKEDENIQARFAGSSDDKFFLVSYVILPDFQSGQKYYGGFCWDLDNLKGRLITKSLEKISEDTGLDYKIVDETDQSIMAGKEETISGESLALTFRVYPLPWKLLVSHPGIKDLEKTARREIFFYGFLLAVIVVLMFFGAVMIARDISREAGTNRLKTEFVNNISHELKTPLTLIRLYGETLQRKENLTEEEKKDSYEIITKESERLSHLINNVLDFSRIEMGRKEFNFTKGHMQDVISDTLESYRYHLEKKGFAVFSNIAGDLPEMDFDNEAIASVLINLLSNAMKFSLKVKEVTVKLFRDGENAVLQVADMGTGISQKEIPKIFERFYQSENKAVTEARGSGLGLTLVKHIVEAHGGKIQVDSTPGKGSTFIIIIPIK